MNTEQSGNAGNKKNNTMKKKPYIAPEIKVVEIEHENIMDHPGSWVMYDENGNIIDKGNTYEGNPDMNDAKESNPFSGEWEL